MGPHHRRSTYLLCLSAALACGGGGSSSPRPPGPPAALVADTGAAAFSVGWDPPADDGGAPVEDYVVTVTPGVTGGGVAGGRTALLRDAANGTPYAVQVAARNAAGTGAPRSVEVTPHAY